MRNPKVILALDVASFREAKSYVKKLKKHLQVFKVGSYLFTLCGPDIVKMIHDEGCDVFLDLKYHDIPNTVAKACEAAAKLGVFLVDMHTSGGEEMMLRAAEAVKSFGKKRPALIGVTVLTSAQNKKSVKNEVLKRTQLALKCGLDGVVCSPWETAYLRQRIQKPFLIVNPGIRFSAQNQMGARGRAGSPSNINTDLALPVRVKDDQKRIATPQDALKAGASYLVIGRPLLEAKDPQSLLLTIPNLGV